MTTQPDITVVLPAYNAAPFIAEAVESILGQTYSNFVLLAMNDGSTDGTGAILDALAVRDSRIRVVHNENRGLVATLNESLALCETDLVARMDADDWCMPDRLRQQKDYMDAHPEVAVCGSSMEVYETGQFFPVPTNVDFFSAVLFRASFAHPTIMYRRSAVLAEGGYDPAMVAAEDYDLWSRMLAAGYKMNNLPQALLRWRRHPSMPRVAYRHAMRQTRDSIWTRQLQQLGITPTPEELDMHAYCADPCVDIAWQQRRAASWMRHIQEVNRQRGRYAQDALEHACQRLLADFPQPCSPWRTPLRYCTRMVRHVFMYFCWHSGSIGVQLEAAVRGFMQHVRTWQNKLARKQHPR